MLGSNIVAIALVRLLCLGLLLVVGGLISPLATVPPLQAPQSWSHDHWVVDCGMVAMVTTCLGDGFPPAGYL